MQKISPFLWFDDQAEEAANFYVSVFKNSEIKTIARYSKEAAKASGRKEGAAMTVAFQLDGQEFIALNGGPQFKFTEAVSFVVNCETQEEIDHYWNKLSNKGKESQCGWLKDQFGLSWQIVPVALSKLLSSTQPERSRRVMNALLQMTRIDISKLEEAYNQQ